MVLAGAADVRRTARDGAHADASTREHEEPAGRRRERHPGALEPVLAGGDLRAAAPADDRPVASAVAGAVLDPELAVPGHPPPGGARRALLEQPVAGRGERAAGAAALVAV